MNANLKLVPTATLTLPANLAFLREHRQFLVCVIVPKPEHPGKTNKFPVSPVTGQYPVSGKDPANWLSCAEAYAKANELNQRGGPHPYGVGFWLTAGLGIWCLDIDQGLDANGQWRPAVQELYGALPGTAWEYSHSRRGMHGWGRGAPLPPHEVRYEDAERGLFLELYSAGHFMLLGTYATGEAQASPMLPPALATLFPALAPEDAAALGAEWTDEPDDKWHGPTDDDALLAIAMNSRSKLATLFPKAAKASFKDLWTANADKLAKHYPGSDGYDASAADQALACHLAFWTGNNWSRIAALMERSGLARPKHARADYMHRTIGKATAWQKEFYNDGKGVAAGAAVPESAATTGIGLEDFYAYLPQKSYIFVPVRELWTSGGVDSAAPWPNSNKPSDWLAQARPVHQMTWAPGEALIVKDRLVSNGGWIHKVGANTFNLYKPPTIVPGNATLAEAWLGLLKLIYPDDWEHLLKFFAHRRQFPGVKVNHGLVLGGIPGIGKDSICEPLKHGVGPWNFSEIAPKDLLEQFNPYLKSVVLRVSEARDQGDMNRYALYEHCKTLLASPPDVLSCNEKNLRQHAVFNLCGVIFTTNHKDGLYLPADDRRHYVAWSERTPADFPKDYWPQLYAWYERGGGFEAVVAYLDSVDLSGFDPKAPPAKTPAFWAMVDAGRAPESGELADALDKLGNPPATALSRVIAASSLDFATWLRDRKNRKAVPHRFEEAGYEALRNPDDSLDGLWRLDQKRQAIYVRKDLSERERHRAVTELRASPAPTGLAALVGGG
jgi:hypothetical protein